MARISKIKLPDGNTHDISPYEEYINWGPDTSQIQGGVSPIGMALSSDHNANRLAFIDTNALMHEYSSDNGSTWTIDNTWNDTAKTTFCISGQGLPVGRSYENGGTEAYTLNSRSRVTITAQNNESGGLYLYTNPKKMLINVSTVYPIKLIIETRTGTNFLNDGPWSRYGGSDKEYILSGWAGWNDIALILGSLGGSSSQTSNNWQLRLTFIPTAINPTYPYTCYVNAFRLFGENNWYVGNTLANKGRLYDINTDKSCNFPNTVRIKGKGAAFVNTGISSGTILVADGAGNTTNGIGITSKTFDQIINGLPTGTGIPVDDDYFISQYVNGGTTNTGYYRRKISTLTNYMDGKLTSLTTPGDKRSTATTPSTYYNKIIFQGLKTNGTINNPSSDSYSYLLGLCGWVNSSGGDSWELAFNNSGIFARHGANSWGNWSKLAYTSDIPTVGTAAAKNYTTSVTSGSSDLVTSGAVYTAIKNLPDPMVFKGSLGTGGTITDLPTDGTASIGDTYKVITEGTYAGKFAEVGDTFICLTKTPSANTWELIPSGDEPSGTVTSVGISAASGTPLSVSGSPVTGSGTITLTHSNSGATAGSYGDSSAQTPTYGGTFKVPYVTVNATGHITSISDHTVKIPASDNTTYTFANGTNGFTVTPSGGTAQTVKVTPSIANNITGSGTSGYIAKFNGANTITNGPAFGSTTTTYLNNAGNWATPPDTKNTAGSTDTSSKIFLVGATSQAVNPQTYSDNEVYVTSGVLTTKKVQIGGGSATIEYNSTTESIDFVFA